MHKAQPSLQDYRGPAPFIEEQTNKLIQDYTRTLDEIGNLYKEQDDSLLTFENTLKKLHIQDGEAANLSAQITLPAMVSVDKDSRDMSNKCKKKLVDFWVGIYSREDVYKTLKQFDSKITREGVQLPTVEDKRLLERTLKLFERNGLSLPKEKRDRVIELRTQISELCNTFERRLNEDVTTVAFTSEELDGCEKEFIASLVKKELDGTTKHLVGMKVRSDDLIS